MNQCEDDVFNAVADKLLTSIQVGIAEAGLPAIKRQYVGMGPVPSEDCCPDVVVWVSNVRFYDSAAPDTLRENRLLEHFGMAFDVNVRIGVCFFEMDGEGKLIDLETVDGWAKLANRYGHTAYLRGIQGLLNDSDLTCLASITPQPMYPFQDGGCAGYTYSVSVGVL
jgi:hypothetical protein